MHLSFRNFCFCKADLQKIEVLNPYFLISNFNFVYIQYTLKTNKKTNKKNKKTKTNKKVKFVLPLAALAQ